MVPPDRTPATRPFTPDQAIDIVCARYGTPAELHVHEFDIGYLVYAASPRPADATGRLRPAPPGGAKIVVSKTTGETVTVPNYPTEQAIALYRKNLTGLTGASDPSRGGAGTG
ncbi:hypothetical protein [Streptomyces sp. NPDC093109]|uniref:hypothetical protein n=1 Tax=Streptomyces sp. NPDC093109 TaxID=3154977 RepID=UPI00344FEBDE